VSTVAGTAASPTPRGVTSGSLMRLLRRNTWTLGLWVLLGLLLIATRIIQPNYGAAGIESLAKAALPIVLVSVGQAVIIISGGIDLSVGSMMALTNVTAASLMLGQSEEFAILAVIAVLLMGIVLGVVNGALVVLTRVPDIVVTLAMSFIWAGAALLVLNTPGGAAATWLKQLISGTVLIEWLPRALVLMIAATSVAWLILKRTRVGLSIYAVGSDRLAAFRSGVAVGPTKVVAYGIGGLYAAMAGLALTMATGIGTPTPGPYTLASVAAVVLGGVSLAGGRGGLVGVVVAVFALRLVRTDLTFLGVDPNYTTVIEGLIMIGVVMVGGLVAMRRKRS
jgi:ribose transport system permease protein